VKKVIMNYNKYESYIRVGHTLNPSNPGDATSGYNCTDLQDFPTPSVFGRALHDVDVDAFTDLEGYTQRNRVRNDVEDIALSYNLLSDADTAFILNAIKYEWIYVELTDKKTLVETKDTNQYVKYLRKSDNATYWYDATNQKLYDASYNEITTFNLSDYIKYVKNAKKVHKMYASDKEWDTFVIWQDESNNWHGEDMEFSFSLVEE